MAVGKALKLVLIFFCSAVATVNFPFLYIYGCSSILNIFSQMHHSFINLFIFHYINYLYLFAFQFNSILSLTRYSSVGNSFLSNNNPLSHIYVNRRLKEMDLSPQNKQSIELSVNNLNLPFILPNRENINSKLNQRNIFKRIFKFSLLPNLHLLPVFFIDSKIL